MHNNSRSQPSRADRMAAWL